MTKRINLNAPSDKELVSRYLNGEHQSLEKLINRHQNKIYAYIVMLVKDKQLADDLFQDTFIKAINTMRAGSYKEEGKFIQWIMRIAHNLIIDHFRRVKRIPVVDNANENFDIFDSISENSPSIEEQLVMNQILSDVKKLIAYLPDEQREVLKMRYYSGMSFKDIAEQTDVSINTALGRMRYALINLRKIVEENEMILTK